MPDHIRDATRGLLQDSSRAKPIMAGSNTSDSQLNDVLKMIKSCIHQLSCSSTYSGCVLFLMVLISGIAVGYLISGHDRGNIELTSTVKKLEENFNRFLSDTTKHHLEETLNSLSNKIVLKFESIITDQLKRFDDIATSLKTINESVIDSSNNFEKTIKKTNVIVDTFDKNVELGTQITTNFQNNITDIVSMMNVGKRSLEKSRIDLEETSNDVVKQLTTLQQDANAEIKQMASSSSSVIKSKLDDYSKTIGDASNAFAKAATNGASLINTFSGLVNEDLHNSITSVKNSQNQFKSLAMEMTDHVSNFKQMMENLAKGSPTKEADSQYMTWFLVIFNITISCFMFFKLRHELQTYMATTIAKGPKTLNDLSINAAYNRGSVQQQPVPDVEQYVAQEAHNHHRRGAPTGYPEYDVTVVTFSEETMEASTKIFPQTLGENWPQPDKVKYKILTGELDLTEIPSSRGYIVLIGCDPRNSILEDIDGSMGSRKCETVVGLQATKRDVLVMYIDSDRQISEPSMDELYNRHLIRASTHPTLKLLVRGNRFLSLRHCQMTPMQVDHISKWVHRLNKYKYAP